MLIWGTGSVLCSFLIFPRCSVLSLDEDDEVTLGALCVVTPMRTGDYA